MHVLTPSIKAEFSGFRKWQTYDYTNINRRWVSIQTNINCVYLFKLRVQV